MAVRRPASFVSKRGDSWLGSDASQVIFQRGSGRKVKMGPRSNLTRIEKDNCKIPMNSTALSLEPLNCNSFEKVFVWSVQFAGFMCAEVCCIILI